MCLSSLVVSVHCTQEQDASFVTLEHCHRENYTSDIEFWLNRRKILNFSYSTFIVVYLFNV